MADEKKSTPPQLGGLTGKAQKALSSREQQIADAEKKALGYANGGVIGGGRKNYGKKK